MVRTPHELTGTTAKLWASSTRRWALTIRKVSDLRRDKLNEAMRGELGILTSGAEGTLHHPSVSFRSREARWGERSSLLGELRSP
jgi:hypothetical protein